MIGVVLDSSGSSSHLSAKCIANNIVVAISTRQDDDGWHNCYNRVSRAIHQGDTTRHKALCLVSRSGMLGLMLGHTSG